MIIVIYTCTAFILSSQFALEAVTCILLNLNNVALENKHILWEEQILSNIMNSSNWSIRQKAKNQNITIAKWIKMDW